MVSSSSSLVIPGMRERKYIIEVCICFELWVECSEIVQFKFLQGDKKKSLFILRIWLIHSTTAYEVLAMEKALL